MANPTKILDAKAKRMYDAWRKGLTGSSLSWNPFTGRRIKRATWARLGNHLREVWRGKALRCAALWGGGSGRVKA